MKVLLVDDESDFLEQAKRFLKKENKQLEITTTTSAEEALEILQKDKHDIVVSDYKMPEMDGLEFLETLRERDENIPFIVLTGKGREEVAMDALNLGADRYLQKGEDTESLYRILSLAIIQEIQRKKATEKIRESEKKYKTIFESTGTGMVILEEDMTISLVNNKFEEITEYAQEEVEGKKWTQFIADEDLKKMKKYHRLRRDNPDAAPQSYRFTYIDKEGNEKTGLMNVALIPNTNKSLISLMDITDRSEMEKRIRKSEREKKLILNSASEAIAYLDRNLKIKLANKAGGEVVGKNPADLEGYHCYEIWHDRDEPCENCPVLKAMKTGEVKEQEIDKFDRVWLIRGAPVKNEKGEIIGGVQIGSDITEREK